MMYFLDPTFKIRSEIPPPTKFVSLKGNRILDRTPAEQPEHVTGTPETPALDLSRAEQAFLDGLDEMDEYEETEEEFHAVVLPIQRPGIEP
jgi:hypothetical protein